MPKLHTIEEFQSAFEHVENALVEVCHCWKMDGHAMRFRDCWPR